MSRRAKPSGGRQVGSDGVRRGMARPSPFSVDCGSARDTEIGGRGIDCDGGGQGGTLSGRESPWVSVVSNLGIEVSCRRGELLCGLY